jgi:hypothetical protein
VHDFQSSINHSSLCEKPAAEESGLRTELWKAHRARYAVWPKTLLHIAAERVSQWRHFGLTDVFYPSNEVAEHDYLIRLRSLACAESDAATSDVIMRHRREKKTLGAGVRPQARLIKEVLKKHGLLFDIEMSYYRKAWCFTFPKEGTGKL